MRTTTRRSALVLALLPVLLAACGQGERLSRVGRPPPLTPLEDPTRDPRWRPVSMPTPTLQAPPAEANSLWRQGSRTFLRDQRAAQVGDLITILVAVDDEAQLQNRTQRNRSGNEQMGVPNLFGLETSVPRVFPSTTRPEGLVNTNSSANNDGNGQVRRNEQITLRLAGTIAQVLPNGNMVVVGRQELRVNSELRELTVQGVVRPQDIASDNTVRHDRLAEARIAYGGRGVITDIQNPRWAQQLLDILLPF
jgi:flagellar L-ring protein precursor FlgH